MPTGRCWATIITEIAFGPALAHETMLWNKEAARTVTLNNESVLKDYSAVTGFNPNDPNTDQGTDMQVAARRNTGSDVERWKRGLRRGGEGPILHSNVIFDVGLYPSLRAQPLLRGSGSVVEVGRVL